MVFEHRHVEISPKSSKELKAEKKKHKYFTKRLERSKRKKKRLEKKKERSKKYYFCIGCNALFQRDFKGFEYVPRVHDRKFIFARQTLCINCASRNRILGLSIREDKLREDMIKFRKENKGKNEE